MTTYMLLTLAVSASVLITWIIARLLLAGKTVPVAEHRTLQQQMRQAELSHAGERARLQTELEHCRDQLAQLRADTDQVGEKLQSQFRVLADAILEEKAARITTQQEQTLKAVLDPVKEHITLFSREYELKRQRESEERISLREQVRQMMELNRNLADQANNLTNALRGNVKQQGNWGEMILERILQYTGLQKDIHYFLQEQSRNNDEKLIQPDVIVRYPDNRSVVIDSKVSLIPYERYCEATETGAQAQALEMLVRSVKAHIDGLSSKAYYDVSEALDFVMMFVPVEGAYIAVMQADPALWQYAYNRKVLLISPTNLVAAMKLVADIWQRDGVNKEAHMLAEKAGRLYDKLVSFVEHLDKIGSQLARTQDTWQTAFRQLTQGRGNLISQAEQMKSFKAKTSKKLPAALTEEALFADGDTDMEDN